MNRFARFDTPDITICSFRADSGDSQPRGPSGLVLAAKSLLAGPSTAGFATRDFGSTRVHPIPLHFLHAILYEWTQPRAQPPKNAFLRPPETRTTGTDCLPTLQAGPRYPRGRACPVGWPSAAPIPVDAGHPVWGGRAAVSRHSHTSLFVECD